MPIIRAKGGGGNMSNVDQIIAKSIETLEENERVLQSYKASYQSVISEQQKLFLELADKINPIIEYLKEQGYHFYNSEFDFRASNGPVIGKDNKFAYIYEGRGHLVTKYDYYNNESKVIVLDNFLSSNSFKLAMEALLSVTNIQSKIIKEFQDEIDKAETELNYFR
jgi:hypothetical protein